MTLYIEIDGQPVSAKDVVWISRAKCGCVRSVSFANSHAANDDDMILTPEQNALDFETPKAVADRHREDGFVDQPITEATWNAVSGDFKDCPHEPQWGRFVAPIPEGMEWRTSDRWFRGRRTYRRHLAPAGAAGDAYPYPPAICGAKTKNGWSSDPNNLRDTVTCRHCEAKAVELDEGVAAA